MEKSKLSLLGSAFVALVFAGIMAISWIIPIAVITLIVLWLVKLYG